MFRRVPRWQPISRLSIARSRPSVRLASTKSKPTPPPKTGFNTWIRRQVPTLALHEPPYSPPVRWVIYALVLITTGHVFVTYFYEIEATYGISMLPTFQSFGDWVLISKYYRRGRGIEAGDVISFKHPVRPGESAIKRVLAMGGDFVLMNTPGKSEAMIQVPEGHCWVVGDNMLHSRDSRMFGPLPMALIAGKVVAKVNRQGTLPEVSWIEHGFQPAYIEDDVD